MEKDRTVKKQISREKKTVKMEYRIDKHKLLWYWMFQRKWKRIVCTENCCVNFLLLVLFTLSCVIADWVGYILWFEWMLKSFWCLSVKMMRLSGVQMIGMEVSSAKTCMFFLQFWAINSQKLYLISRLNYCRWKIIMNPNWQHFGTSNIFIIILRVIQIFLTRTWHFENRKIVELSLKMLQNIQITPLSPSPQSTSTFIKQQKENPSNFHHYCIQQSRKHFPTSN